jgi:hypothetical protein
MKPPISHVILVAVGLFLVALAPIPLTACDICNGSLRSQTTLGEEMEHARLVVFGRAVASEISTQPGATPGSGRTDFHITRILKDDALLVNKKEMILGRYLVVPDPKDPPRMLIFCAARKDQLDAYLGKGVGSESAIAYLEGGVKARKEGRVPALQYYFQFLDDADDVICHDAFLEFARANNGEVEKVRRSLKPEKIRALMQNRRTRVEFLGLLGFLLGGCGEARDADYLLDLINRNDEASHKARDGLLSGYLSLKPREGWDLLRSHLADSKRPFDTDRFPAINAVRFCYNLKLGEYRQGMLRCMEAILPDGEVADFAVEDLRTWQVWDLTPVVLGLYDKTSHAAPITRRAILRYALCCPLSEARQFVDRVRGRDGEMVREVEEGLR